MSRSLLSAGLLTLAVSASFAAPPQAGSVDPRANETKAQRDARMKWWREARFGMFIHWGSYAVPAGVYQGKNVPSIGEWIMHTAHIPVATYEQYANQFDPEKFDATEWVSYAKAAGMKYIVMTAKHHEGFAMYPTKVDDYSIAGRTKFKRDPIGEMSAACKKAGIKFGVYYSQNLDWHHKGGGTAGPSWDDAQKGDFHEYVRKVSAPQVNELLSKYHPAVLWWDINGPFTPEEVKLLTAPFAFVPGIISNNRLGGGVPGDTETPEQFIPATGFKGRDWETCMTMNDTWGYKSTDHNFKSTTTLLRNLIDIASKGGNYLLNVGPTAEGIIPEPEVQRLKEMGDWMNINGASVYKTSASPYKRLPFDGRATVGRNTLYLNVFTWPSEGLVLHGLKTGVRNAKVLATGQRLTISKSADGAVSISRPAKLDTISTSIALSLDGPVVVDEPEVQIQPKNGQYVLGAADAQLDGNTIQAQETPVNLGYWTNQADGAHWIVNTPADASGLFRVSVNYSCDTGTQGSNFSILVDGPPAVASVQGTVAETGGWGAYRRVDLDGLLKLTPGRHRIWIMVTKKPGYAVMNLRGITLTPQKQ